MGKKPAGIRASRGIDAYQKTMESKTGKKPEQNSVFFKNDTIETGLLKTTKAESDGKPKYARKPVSNGKPEYARKAASPDSKYKRAAQFMVLIGSDEASKILPRLDPEQVAAISKEIVSIRSISPGEAEAVLEEFRSLLSPSYGYSGSSSGGLEEARRHLYAAFGPEKGEALLVKAVPEAAANPFDFLSDFSGEQLALLFRDESFAVCAMVFPGCHRSRRPQYLPMSVPKRSWKLQNALPGWV